MGNTIAPRIENAEKTGVLQVSSLKLKKVPEQVKHLRNLRSLDLSNNKIENIDPWISVLKNLKVLNVENNKLIYGTFYSNEEKSRLKNIRKRRQFLLMKVKHS
ncbi:hypothetical protein Smp_149480 [Schistosoma mansoni]|uniref:hypothetical protein n=1 Tax=Schistosoma mansoni TaxID=6183 RepID=UPI0001A640AB|nr:hypothetical protein Smp_149480 [Schistosoma mansoni]|eukprot:XP_018653320.1 hypothetical protein Smp_149480 [Schistosoma mansoni]